MRKPKVSILMPVYNAERYVGKAIESMLNQTFVDYEYIIINDGSTDNSLVILFHYAQQDSRIRLIENEGNQGLIYTLNKGIELARGEYIARMDADDMSLPDRLAYQVQYMEQHLDVGVLGSNITFIDDKDNFTNCGVPKDNSPLSSNVIRWLLLWRCAIYHPTVMIRRNVLEQTGLRYDPKFQHVEDFDLWTRLVEFTNIVSIPQILLHYRMIPESVSRVHRQVQRSCTRDIIRRELLKFMGNVESNESMEALIGNFTNKTKDSSDDFVGAADLLCDIYGQFCVLPLSKSDRHQIESDVSRRLLVIGRSAAAYSPKLAFDVLWRFHHLSKRQLLSPETWRGVVGMILRTIGFR